MSTKGAYIVLEMNHSSSSSKVYETRRGGDGVLYCTCQGWAFNKASPKVCKHTKDYVAQNPGTSYGPPGMFAAGCDNVGPIKGSKPNARRASVASVPQVASVAAGGDWRSVLLAEKANATKRGVATPPNALMAYAMDLDLD